MKLTPGNFVKVKHNCQTETAIIEHLDYHNGKLAYVQCSGLNKMWARSFRPDEIIEVMENPDAQKYLKEREEQQRQVRKYIIADRKPVKIVPNEYEDGYLNNFE